MLTSYKSNEGTLHQITVHFNADVAQLISQFTVQCTLHSIVFFYCTLLQPKDFNIGLWKTGTISTDQMSQKCSISDMKVTE